MEKNNVYENITERTQGNIYIGVVGPVRTGKSTFIKRFMDLLVVPNIENEYIKERVTDELPQSGSGKTIMTTEPKFVPAEAVEIRLNDNTVGRIRLIDCVGYLVDGTLGHAENGYPRMVRTPWSEETMTFEKAAETGTHKVISEHSTIGLVVTTDGSFSDIPVENYAEAEARVIRELQELKKPFAVIMNSSVPDSEAAETHRIALEKKYGLPVISVNCAEMTMDTLNSVLTQVLNEFPVNNIEFELPGFIGGLDPGNSIRKHLERLVLEWSSDVICIRDVTADYSLLKNDRVIKNVYIDEISMGDGRIKIKIELYPELFYQVLSGLINREVKNDREFFRVIKELSEGSIAYEKFHESIKQAELTGYGILRPELDELSLEEPELFKQGNKYGVRIRAKAPSLHLIKVELSTEVAPVIGTETQAGELLEQMIYKMENEPGEIWNTNLFGKSLIDTVSGQISAKATCMPENIRYKVQRSVQKIADDGKDYFICIII